MAEGCGAGLVGYWVARLLEVDKCGGVSKLVRL
jgi:hypothetical protein